MGSRQGYILIVENIPTMTFQNKGGQIFHHFFFNPLFCDNPPKGVDNKFPHPQIRTHNLEKVRS